MITMFGSEAFAKQTPSIARAAIMEVIDPRAALLSNFEVLTLLRELETEHLQRTKTALRIKKEEDGSGPSTSTTAPIQQHSTSKDSSNTFATEDVCENLRTVEVEAIQYLSSEYQPTTSQSSAAITQLVKDLAPYELTKAEKLQVVNLAPTEPVELYVIVEELEDRLGDRMDAILDRVRASLHTPSVPAPPPISQTQPLPPDSFQQPGPSASALAPEPLFIDAHEDWDTYLHVTDDEFDDTGEGVGVDGDLDIEDD